MANLTAQQRYGLGAAPAGASKPMGGLAQKRKTKAVTVSGKPKAFADGGKVDATQADVRKRDSYKPSQMPIDEKLRVRNDEFNNFDEKFRAREGARQLGASNAVQSGLDKETRSAAHRFVDDVDDKPYQYAKGGKVKRYADGGKVEGKEPIPRIEVTAKRMTPAEAKAYDEAQKQQPEALRTINGAPIRNPRPANLPAGSGGVRG